MERSARPRQTLVRSATRIRAVHQERSVVTTWTGGGRCEDYARNASTISIVRRERCAILANAWNVPGTASVLRGRSAPVQIWVQGVASVWSARNTATTVRREWPATKINAWQLAEILTMVSETGGGTLAQSIMTCSSLAMAHSTTLISRQRICVVNVVEASPLPEMMITGEDWA